MAYIDWVMRKELGGRNDEWRASRKAFTLVELLVVVAIIVVLAALVFTVSGRMTKMAHRADSVNDLRTLANLVIAGANENSGQFPVLHKGMNNPHHFNKRNPDNAALDAGLLTLEDLIEGGLTQDTAFCMANKRWSSRADHFWYEFGGGRTAVFSYVYIANDNGWADDNSRFVRPTDDPRLAQFGRSIGSLHATPSSAFDDRVWYPYLWADVCRQFGDDFLANHMDSNGEVEGMNVVHMDGHCEWKNGRDIKERFSSGSLKFYW